MARIKEVFPNDQVAHMWANQTQEHARSPNNQTYYNGRIFYSYGSHWPMAVLLPKRTKNSRQIVVLNVGHYSMTTSKHLWSVKSALRGLDVDIVETDGPGLLREYCDSYALTTKSWWKTYAKPLAASLYAERLSQAQRRHAVLLNQKVVMNDDGSAASNPVMQDDDIATVGWFSLPYKRKLAKAVVKLQTETDARFARLAVAHVKAANDPKKQEKLAKAKTRRRAAKRARYEDSIRAMLQEMSGRDDDQLYSIMNPGYAQAHESVWQAVQQRVGRGECGRNRWEWEQQMDEVFGVDGGREQYRAIFVGIFPELDQLERRYSHVARTQLERWYAGTVSQCPSGSTKLRIKDGWVQTSRGAQVRLSEARKLFQVWTISRTMGQPYTIPPGSPVKVGGFDLREIDDEGNIQIGCHTLGHEECERFRPILAAAFAEQRGADAAAS